MIEGIPREKENKIAFIMLLRKNYIEILNRQSQKCLQAPFYFDKNSEAKIKIEVGNGRREKNETINICTLILLCLRTFEGNERNHDVQVCQYSSDKEEIVE